MNPLTQALPAFLRRRDAQGRTGRWLSSNGRYYDGEHEADAIWIPATTGALELVLHCTWVQDHYVCPRKFWLRYGELLRSTGPRPALNNGGAIHAALGIRHRALMADSTAPVASYEPAQLAALEEWFAAKPQPSDEWRNCGRAQDTIRAYNEQWPTDEWRVLAVEEEFEVRVGSVTLDDPSGELPGFGGKLPQQVPVFLAGRKDLVVAWHDGIWIPDNKTAQDWGGGDSNSHLDEGRRSFQFKGYAWAERAKREQENQPYGDADPRATLPVLGAVGNYLISRKPYAEGFKPRSNAAPRNQFHRECFAYEPSTLDEWRSTCLAVAETILQNWSRNRWPDQDTGCGHWGRCEFWDYCEEAPDRREALLSSSLFEANDLGREL